MFLMCLAALWCGPSVSVDYRVEAINEAAPADAISKEIAAKLSPTGLRVFRGESRKMFDIWLCKEWDMLAQTEAKAGIIFSFQPGQLIGVIRFNNKGSDFRNQEISKGVYTLRYTLQPVDGDHVGTSPARDFLLLIKSDDDKTAAVLDYDTIVEKSATAAETSHPAQFLLQQAEGDRKFPSMYHRETQDWWLLRCEGQAKRGEKVEKLQLEMVLVGHADE